jgi:hypothetical protein
MERATLKVLEMASGVHRVKGDVVNVAVDYWDEGRTRSVRVNQEGSSGQ